MESAQSWKELLLDLKRRGLSMGPELAVADAAGGPRAASTLSSNAQRRDRKQQPPAEMRRHDQIGSLGAAAGGALRLGP